MRKRSAAVYAFGHFLVDFSCAYLMISTQPSGWLFITYNFCAFALQMPIGLLADITGRNRSYALAGIALAASALLPLPIALRVLLAGVGNACYHVGGGRDALLTDNKLTGLGLFVSPGAIGIYLGTVLAGISWLSIVVLSALLLTGIGVFLVCSGEQKTTKPEKPHIGNAWLMFLVVVLRSLVGMCMENPWKIGIFVACGAVAAAAGKFLGGFTGDKLGSKRTGVFSLILAAVLFCLPNSTVAGILGCVLFNMTMPITLKNAALALPGYEGFSFGLLTFALFLGYLPTTVGVTVSPYIGALLALVSALLLVLYREKRND